MADSHETTAAPPTYETFVVPDHDVQKHGYLVHPPPPPPQEQGAQQGQTQQGQGQQGEAAKKE